VIAVDELAELDADAMALLECMARMGRDEGIILIAVTQRPSADVLGGPDARAQMTARIALGVVEPRDGELILGAGRLSQGWRSDRLAGPGYFVVLVPGQHEQPRPARRPAQPSLPYPATIRLHLNPEAPGATAPPHLARVGQLHTQQACRASGRESPVWGSGSPSEGALPYPRSNNGAAQRSRLRVIHRTGRTPGKCPNRRSLLYQSSTRSSLSIRTGICEMHVVIPAAGLGSRFLPLSRIVPKELLPFGAKPLIHHALDEAECAGFAKAIVVLSPCKTAIRAYFDPDPELEHILEAREQGSSLRLVREACAIARRLDMAFVEQPAPLGLGDAVLKCRSLAGDRFAVLLPDDVVTTNSHWPRLLALNARTGGACLCVRPVPRHQMHRFGMAVCEESESALRVCALREKPSPSEVVSDLAVFGRYIVTAPVLDALAGMHPGEGGELGLTEGLTAAASVPPGVYAAPFEGERFDGGTPTEYARSAARYARCAT
jgi:UTP--glucose-1-phosphate uridylyltransferase